MVRGGRGSGGQQLASRLDVSQSHTNMRWTGIYGGEEGEKGERGGRTC